jgi:serine/threonine-protein kinase HipA
MNICPITYRPCEGKYSPQGLRRLSPRLQELMDLAYTADEQIREAAARASKMSIQGVQPKLSARLSLAKRRFEIVDIGGHYILKPQNPLYAQLPENEDVSMRLAGAAGVDIPLHGLVYAKDGSLTYFIKRFDRIGRNRKLALEDFAQILGLSRDTKYDASMEKVGAVIESYCTFPVLEKIKLFRFTLVNFLIGNEDMHLKNFSLINRAGKIELSPAYDLVNTSIVMGETPEEVALPVMGKKRKLDRSVLVDYFGGKRLGLKEKVVARVLREIQEALPAWQETIRRSFLDPETKERYERLMLSRHHRLFS